jgi:hypothetical protein
VFVIVEPPNTEKLAAFPNPTLVAPRALLAKIRVDSEPSIINPIRNVLRRVFQAERCLTARESPIGDSCCRETPR